MLYILVGIVGGLIGGMGMGGGTLLIPLLTIFCSVSQHIAQSINLIAFIPMSVVAIIIHAKNGLIKGEYFWWVALPATAVGIIASLIVKDMDGKLLSACFGYFLIVLGVYQLITAIISCVKEHKNKKKKLDKGEKV
ncbi:MAG: sulfite exporter TauE/SafE family protein [Clostridiales bacterium]|nr:sulfite exporter TauE/SafE family protein [Clostridiales bacterium]